MTNYAHCASGMQVACCCTAYAQAILDEDDITVLVRKHLPIALERLGMHAGLYQFTYDAPSAIGCVVFVQPERNGEAVFYFSSDEEADMRWDSLQGMLSMLGEPIPC